MMHKYKNLLLWQKFGVWGIILILLTLIPCKLLQYFQNTIILYIGRITLLIGFLLFYIYFVIDAIQFIVKHIKFISSLLLIFLYFILNLFVNLAYFCLSLQKSLHFFHVKNIYSDNEYLSRFIFIFATQIYRPLIATAMISIVVFFLMILLQKYDFQIINKTIGLINIINSKLALINSFAGFIMSIEALPIGIAVSTSSSGLSLHKLFDCSSGIMLIGLFIIEINLIFIIYDILFKKTLT